MRVDSCGYNGTYTSSSSSSSSSSGSYIYIEAVDHTVFHRGEANFRQDFFLGDEPPPPVAKSSRRKKQPNKKRGKGRKKEYLGSFSADFLARLDASCPGKQRDSQPAVKPPRVKNARVQKSTKSDHGEAIDEEMQQRRRRLPAGLHRHRGRHQVYRRVRGRHVGLRARVPQRPWLLSLRVPPRLRAGPAG
ncbi:unnamed protein product [Trichogramma brassicae]|uniref:Uncharacterized protein n=1 Tax=Trichogramma brassicae TaxID=86971 RepID=A0A6H5HYR2_9HYME|nr:unnamed protein product [Trichogramma brassicae]